MDKIKKKIIGTIFSNHTQSVASAAVILGAATIASSLLGVVRARLLVGSFGISNDLDAYFAAFQVPNFAYNLLISATLSVAFIPVFCEYLGKDKERAWRIANSVLNITIILMGVLSFLFFLFAPYLVKLVSPGFTEDKFLMTVNLTRILMLSPFLFSVSSVFSSILNSFRSFILVALAPLIYNLAIILGIIFLAPSTGIYGVAAAVIVGAFLHILIQVPGAIKFGFKWRPVIDAKDQGVKEILKLVIPRILALDTSQISQLVGTVIGSTLLVGSVAIFNLVFNIESLPIGIFAISFVVSVFPSLSTDIASRNFEEFKRDFSYAARQILFFLIPLSILTFVFRAQVIRLVIGARNLSWDDTRLAAGSLAIFALSFIFQGLTPLFARAFFSLKNTFIPLGVSLVSILFNLLGTYLFLIFINQDGVLRDAVIVILKLDGITDLRALSLPIGFSLASSFNAIALFLILRWKFRHLDIDTKKIFFALVKYLSAAVVSGLVGYGSLYLIEPYLDTRSFMGILFQLVFSTIWAAVTFSLVALLLKSEEITSLMGAIGKRMGRSVKVLDVPSVDKL